MKPGACTATLLCNMYACRDAYAQLLIHAMLRRHDLQCAVCDLWEEQDADMDIVCV